MITEERIEELALQVMLRAEGRAGTNKRLRTALRDAARESAAAENEACERAVDDSGGDNKQYHIAAIRARRQQAEGEGE